MLRFVKRGQITSNASAPTSSGVFSSRIQQDPKSTFNAFASIRNNMSNLLGNIFVLFYMFYINPIIGLITLIGTICVYLIEKKGIRKMGCLSKVI